MSDTVLFIVGFVGGYLLIGIIIGLVAMLLEWRKRNGGWR